VIVPEPRGLANAPCVPEVARGIVPAGIKMVENGSEVVVRVPGDVAVKRAAALARAVRGLP